jgi:uncharacterized protein
LLQIMRNLAPTVKATVEAGSRRWAFGFPLHPAGKRLDERARHLADVKIPILFLQGDRDALADTGLLVPAIQGLGQRATLHSLAGADHSFHVLRGSTLTAALRC